MLSPLTTIVGGPEFNNANNLSLNSVPDVIGKVAYDNPIDGHSLHVEMFGIYRDFYDRLTYPGGVPI